MVTGGASLGKTTRTRIEDSFYPLLNFHGSIHVHRFAAFQDEAVERHFRFGEWLVGRHNEVESRGGIGSERGTIFGAADDPLRCLADHFALVVEQEGRGTGGFELLGEGVFHLQFDDGFAACRFRLVNFHRQLRVDECNSRRGSGLKPFDAWDNQGFDSAGCSRVSDSVSKAPLVIGGGDERFTRTALDGAGPWVERFG